MLTFWGVYAKPRALVAQACWMEELELMMGLEPMTSPLPRECSTTELHRPEKLVRYSSHALHVRTGGIPMERVKGIEPSS